VHYCRTDEGTVFLDLRKRRYFGLAEARSRALGGVVQGWSCVGGSGTLTAVTSADSAMTIAEQLVREGILTRDPVADTQRLTDQVARAETAAADGTVYLPPSVQLRDAIYFARAVARAAMLLKRHSLENIVARVRCRKGRTRACDARPAADRFDHLARVFAYLRPFLFTARDACLFDSLALVEFLGNYQLFPLWVIGVKTQPFGAHSWVQHEHRVLNDTAERARHFTPILVV
jgi:hypothetical protein